MSATTPLPRWLKPANRIVKFLHRLGVPLGAGHGQLGQGRTIEEIDLVEVTDPALRRRVLTD